MSSVLAGSNIGKMMDDWRDLLVEPFFDESHGFGSEGLGERGITLGEIVQSSRNELPHFSCEHFFADQALKPLFHEMQDLIECLIA